MEPTPDESDIPGVVGRRSARLSIIVPVTVRGTDAAGQAFKENTWTICVNKHGGRIATFHQLAVDDQIVIEVQGRTAKARVKRVCEKRFAEDPFEVCVELLEAQNVWGVKLPPEDWEKEQQVPLEERKGSGPQPAPPARDSSAAAVEESGKVESAPPALQGSPAEVGEHTGGLSQFNMAVHALSRFAGEASATPVQPTPPQQDTVKVAKEPARDAQTSDLVASGSLQEKIDEAQSLRQELSVLLERLQSVRGEVENLLLKAGEARREGALEVEQAVKQIEEASGTKLQSVLSRLDQEAEQKLETASARLAGETQQRLQAEAAGIVESVTKDFGERLSPLAQENLSAAILEFQTQCKRTAEEAKAELDELAKDATAAVDVRIREITEEVSPLLSGQIERSAEQVAREKLEEFKAQIESSRRSSEDSIQQDLEAMRQQIQADSLNAGTQARQFCNEECGTAAKAISVCVDSAVDSLNRAGDEAAARLEGARQTLELRLQKAEESLPRLAGESASVLEKFRAETQALAAQLQSEVESTTREASERTSREISDKLEGNVEAALELVVTDLNKQAEDARELLKEDLRSARDQCVEETQNQLAAVRHSALSALESEAAEKSASYREQLRAALETQAQQTKEMETGVQASLGVLLESLRAKIQSTEAACVGETEKQLAAVRQSTLTALESEAAEKSASYREQLRAALETQAQQTKEMETGVRTNLEGLLESLRAKIQSTEAACVEETEKQLAAVRQSTLTALESEALEKSASYREQLRAALETQAQQAKEMETGIQASLEGLLESLRAKTQSTEEVCVEETEKQLAAVRQSTLSALESEAAEKSASYCEQLQATLLEMQAQQTKALGAGIQASLQGLLESLRVKIQSTEEQCVEETQKQLAAVRQSTLALLESEAVEKSASYREQLRTALLETQAEQMKEMETGIQGISQGLLQSLHAKIQVAADEAAAQVAAEVRSNAEQALQELPDRLYKSVGMVATVAKEWEEQAKTELEAHLHQLVEVFEKRLEELSAAAQERQRSDAEAFKVLLQRRLNQAARLFEGLATEAGRTKAADREEAGAPPSPPPQPSKETSPPVLEPLLEKQRRIVEDALGAFRSRLSQTLSGQTPKG